MEIEAISESQLPVWQTMTAFARSMALKCAVELRLADIIHSYDTPISLSQIASSIDSSSAPNISYLERIMRLLVRSKIFTAHHSSLSDDGEGVVLYGPSDASPWILRDSEISIAPYVLFTSHSTMITPWTFFSQCVKEGGDGFMKTHGEDQSNFASHNPEFNNVYNEAMTCRSKMTSMAFIEKYRQGFSGITTIVDVGGGTGWTVAAIVEDNPHIVEGINFDLPHVVSNALEYDRVSHVGGNMFDGVIPKADAIFLKFILHNWTDAECITILKNCQQGISKKTGKIMIVEDVLNPYGSNPYDELSVISDLGMLAVAGGKERTTYEWKKLLQEAGFPRYEIIEIVPPLCVIEAYLE